MERPSIHSAKTEGEGAEREMGREELKRMEKESGEISDGGGPGGGAERRIEGKREEEAVRVRSRAGTGATGRDFVVMISVMRDKSTVQSHRQCMPDGKRTRDIHRSGRSSNPARIVPCSVDSTKWSTFRFDDNR